MMTTTKRRKRRVRWQRRSLQPAPAVHCLGAQVFVHVLV